MANCMPPRNYSYPTGIFTFDPNIGVGRTPSVSIRTLSNGRWHDQAQLLGYVVEYSLFKVRARNMGGYVVTDQSIFLLPCRYMKDDRNVVLVNCETRSVVQPLSEIFRLGIDRGRAFAVDGVYRATEVKPVETDWRNSRSVPNSELDRDVCRRPFAIFAASMDFPSCL